jgi:hypothetical protein
MKEHMKWRLGVCGHFDMDIRAGLSEKMSLA